ncbi:MAG: PCRF domain-containing protein, partial [Planctomycetes bacterium]|nr:PCRF domain-containing protein [Planctomycetota bacterium]
MIELEKKMAAPGFWDDQESAAPIIVELKTLKAVVAPVTELLAGVEDLEVLYELADEAGSDEDLQDAAAQEQA